MSSSAGVLITSTATRDGGRPGTPSTTPSPHRVRPGSTPSTRETGRGVYGLIAPARSSAPSRPVSSGEHLFATLPRPARPRGEARRECPCLDRHAASGKRQGGTRQAASGKRRGG